MDAIDLLRRQRAYYILRGELKRSVASGARATYWLIRAMSAERDRQSASFMHARAMKRHGDARGERDAREYVTPIVFATTYATPPMSIIDFTSRHAFTRASCYAHALSLRAQRASVTLRDVIMMIECYAPALRKI